MLAQAGHSRLNSLSSMTPLPVRLTLAWTERVGRPGRPLAPVLGISPQAVCQAVARRRADVAEWQRLLKSGT